MVVKKLCFTIYCFTNSSNSDLFVSSVPVYRQGLWLLLTCTVEIAFSEWLNPVDNLKTF